MRLYPIRQIVEASCIRNITTNDTTGEVMNFIRQRIPNARSFVGRCIFGCLYGMSFDDQRVEIDHSLVVVEKFDDSFPGKGGGEGGYCREDIAFGHVIRHFAVRYVGRQGAREKIKINFLRW